MSSDRTISIIAPAGGRKNFVALNVPIKNLATYSQVAKHHYFPDAGSRNPISSAQRRSLSNRTEFDLGEGMDEEYARTIAAFIKASDPATPKQITLALFGTNLPVAELVRIWRILGHGFKLPRELHDESIRNDLRLKMYQTNPYSSADFKLIGENLDFDRGLVPSAMDRVAFLHVKNYLDDKTKQEVEDYCKSREGYWDSLLETTGRVQVKIDEAAQQKAARELKQAEQDSSSNKGAPKPTTSPENKASFSSGNKSTPREGLKGGEKTDAGVQSRGASSGGKSKTGKGKAKQPPAPFVRKDEDFPPLA